jgi:hypothetical protein
MNNKQVIQHFIYGNEAKTENLFSEENNGKLVLFSYGYHFPLCIKLKDKTLLFNCEGYSQTTKRHKGDLCRELGFLSFRDMVEKNKNLILLDTEELKQVIRNDKINSYADFIAHKI